MTKIKGGLAVEFMIKAAGAVMVFVSCGLIGYVMSLKDDLRVADLREMRRALCILKSEIGFAVNVLPQAFANIAFKTKGAVSKMFLEVGVNMENGDRRPEAENLAELWRTICTAELKGSRLAAEDVRQVADFGQTLGYLDTELQMRGIDMLCEYIDGAIEATREVTAKNKRMRRSLGIIFGLVAIVVLF
jgi:stage III sporulation protein AB